MRKKQKSVVALAVIAAFMAATLFLPGLVSAGHIDPIDPSPPPDPTTKTLDEIPPTWSQKLQCDTTACPRFELVLDGEAVLDKETGLVWEQSPDTTTMIWTNACSHCYQRMVANRKGWRLPTIEELASLVDDDHTDPGLPTGHPFNNVQSYAYWSSTTVADNSNRAWTVNFNHGYVYDGGAKSINCNVWCVRGGHGYDAY